MKKLLISLTALLLLVGCSNNNETLETEQPTEEQIEAEHIEDITPRGLKIIAPQGAPALTLLPIVTKGDNDVTTVEGADAITAELSKTNPEYDVIIAPTNLGVKLAATGNSDYKLLAVVDWGNLYIVGDDENALDEGHEVAAFGENAVPGLVFKKAYEGIGANVTFYNDVSDAREMLLAGNANAALLAEPAATATIAAAKEKDMNLSIISNVQEAWGTEGFPMASMFVLEDAYEENREMYDELLRMMQTYADVFDANDPSSLINDINERGPEFYGVPKAEIVGACYKRMNIAITRVADCKDEIARFLEMFDVTDIDDALIMD